MWLLSGSKRADDNGGYWATGSTTGAPTDQIAPFFGREPLFGAGAAGRRSGFASFDNVPIAQGTTLVTAKYVITRIARKTTDEPLVDMEVNVALHPTGWPPDGTYQASCDIYAEDVDDGTAFTLQSELTNATRTTATSTLTLTNVISGSSTVSTPQYAAGAAFEVYITAQVQEVINRAGWVSGNRLNILFDEDNTTTAVGLSYITYAALSEYGNYSEASWGGRLEWT